MKLKKMSKKARIKILKNIKIPLDDDELLNAYKILNIKRKMFITYIINFMALEEIENKLRRENLI